MSYPGDKVKLLNGIAGILDTAIPREFWGQRVRRETFKTRNNFKQSEACKKSQIYSF